MSACGSARNTRGRAYLEGQGRAGVLRGSVGCRGLVRNTEKAHNSTEVEADSKETLRRWSMFVPKVLDLGRLVAKSPRRFERVPGPAGPPGGKRLV